MSPQALFIFPPDFQRMNSTDYFLIILSGVWTRFIFIE